MIDEVDSEASTVFLIHDMLFDHRDFVRLELHLKRLISALDGFETQGIECWSEKHALLPI